MPMNVTGIAPYPDFLSFAFVMMITGIKFVYLIKIYFLFFFIFKIALMVVGVKESSLLNKIFTALNILVILFIVAFGASKLDIKNWQIKPSVILN
jgi:cationic amino acid transporter 3